MITTVLKRDGKKKNKFNPEKISKAIEKAMKAVELIPTDDVLDKLTEEVCTKLEDHPYKSIQVEKIHDVVEKVLYAYNQDAGKAYILFRKERDDQRFKKSKIVTTIREIKNSSCQSSNILRDNANESGGTPAGNMAKVGSETNKMYNLLDVIDKRFSYMHAHGRMHIHDLNYYDLSFNCLFADIGKLLSRGFDSGTGFIRSPKSIQTAAQLTAVILQLQSNQQFGGIASANLDFELAPYVNLSFKKNLCTILAEKKFYEILADIPMGVFSEAVQSSGRRFKDFISYKQWLNDHRENTIKALTKRFELQYDSCGADFEMPYSSLCNLYDEIDILKAYTKTENDTYQAMEGLIHNLNSLQSRSGNQVPFSSLNFGIDTSRSGHMLSKQLISAQMAGLGDGLTAIFPILIFKMMKGVNKLPDDPNYDLYEDTIKCLARRFYPNGLKVDSKFNLPYIKYDTCDIELTDDTIVKKIGSDDLEYWGNVKNAQNEYPRWEVNVDNIWWQIKDGKAVRIKPETTASTMGCRTRVIGNINGVEQTVGRGNFAFHTMNLPQLAIEAHIEESDLDKRKVLFFQKLDELLEAARDSLIDRYNLICRKTYENYPFTMQQGLYLTSDDKPHNVNDTIEEVMKQSTLSIGYCGLYETMLLLTGKTWGKDTEIFDYGYSIIKRIYDFCKKTEKATHLNWSCFATPAEATAGRFCNIDKNQYGNHPKLADVDEFQLFGKGYYTNSHMLPFDLDTTLANKMKWEAPFHPITTAGHIFYHKIDGDLSKNLEAVKKSMDAMYDADLGYFTVTMDSDTCIATDDAGNRCGFHGVINDCCPKCGNCDPNKIIRIRRITGYLTGSPLKSIEVSWNDGKLNEWRNRKNI